MGRGYGDAETRQKANSELEPSHLANGGTSYTIVVFRAGPRNIESSPHGVKEGPKPVEPWSRRVSILGGDRQLLIE